MMTKHVVDRMQQRGIPPLILDWLIEFGHKEHDGNGAVVRYFDKASRRRMSSQLGAAVIRRLEDFMDAYLVQRDETIVTTGWRYKRIRRQ